MAEVFDDRVSIRNSATGDEIVVLDATSVHEFRDADGVLRVRIDCDAGMVSLLDETGGERVRVAADPAELTITDGDSTAVVRVAEDGALRVGDVGLPGGLRLVRDDGSESIRINGQHANLSIGGHGADGDIALHRQGSVPGQDHPAIRFNGDRGALAVMLADGTIVAHLNETGRLRLGGDGQHGQLQLLDTDGNQSVRINGRLANVVVGGRGADGNLMLFRQGSVPGQDPAAIQFDGDRGALEIKLADGTTVARLDETGRLRLGADGQHGRIAVLRSNGARVLLLDGENGNLFLGGNGADGDISLFPASVTGTINAQDLPSIHLDADAGDITLRNADTAEEFGIEDAQTEPGDVVVIASDTGLVRSSRPYDPRVAGVVAGAGPLQPAIILNRQAAESGRLPVSLSGTTYCKVDAGTAPVRVGDLLTTSATPGHAMRAADRDRSFGAVLGKALEPLREGTQMLPILVCLQ